MARKLQPITVICENGLRKNLEVFFDDEYFKKLLVTQDKKRAFIDLNNGKLKDGRYIYKEVSLFHLNDDNKNNSEYREVDLHFKFHVRNHHIGFAPYVTPDVILDERKDSKLGGFYIHKGINPIGLDEYEKEHVIVFISSSFERE